MSNKANSSVKRQPSKEFAVIGLGRFGASLARRLESMGHMVLGIDQEMGLVQAISGDITSAVALDATNEDALMEVDIASFNTVIITLGDAFEATALVTTYLKALGVKQVICTARTGTHRDILMRIGADQVILSDEDSGIRLAETLATPNMNERVLLDSDHSLAELKLPTSLAGQTISHTVLRDVAVLLIQRPGQLIPRPAVETYLQTGDTLFLFGEREKLLELASLP